MLDKHCQPWQRDFYIYIYIKKIESIIMIFETVGTCLILVTLDSEKNAEN